MTRTRSLFAADRARALRAAGDRRLRLRTTRFERADPQEVVDATFNNDEQVTSGVIDLSVDASAGDQGSFTLSLSGPFQGVEDDPTALPQLDLTASVRARARARASTSRAASSSPRTTRSWSTAARPTRSAPTTFAQLKESIEASSAQAEESTGGRRHPPRFQEGCEQAIEAQGGDPAACDFDVSGWFTDLANDGTEDVEGTESVHISGNVDVATDARRHRRHRRVGPERPAPGGPGPDRPGEPRRSPRPASTSTAARTTTSCASWT